jgi:hypothetical protein
MTQGIVRRELIRYLGAGNDDSFPCFSLVNAPDLSNVFCFVLALSVALNLMPSTHLD